MMTDHIPADRGNQWSRARRQAARRWALGRSRCLPALLGSRLCSLSVALLLACFCSSPLHAKIIKGPYLQRVTTDGITVMDDLAAGVYPMPINATHKDDVFVGRIREDLSSETGLAFWCVSDNLRKGAATNAVQIAELLVQSKASV